MTENTAKNTPTGQLESFPYQGKWHNVRHGREGWFYLKGGIDGIPRELKGSELEDVQNIIRMYKDNRISFFLPHGDGREFINDWENGICLLTAGTRQGKSCHGIAWTLFRTLNCNPDWHCFQHHGIDYHEFRGPRKQVISSYSWSNVEEVFQEVLKWTPRHLLGPYALDWGMRDGETAKAKTVSFNGKSTRMPLTDGNEFIFLCDGQAQGAWEGRRWDDGFFDEQRGRSKFIGFLRGQGNTQGLVQSCMCLTGHVLPDRPDTGSSGWIKTELYDGEYTFGKTVGKYQITVDDVPDEVLSPKRKEELYEQWVAGPERTQNEDDKRAAIARYFGGWEPGSGLVLDCFEPKHHVVPIDIDWKQEVFQDTTKYRGIDHGLGRPCACSWGMMFPWGDLLIYREYYEKGRNIPYHAKQIAELSGSIRQKGAQYKDEMAGETFDTWEEIYDREEYHSSVLDGRSFASPAQESQRTIGQLYQDWGLNVSPARGWRNEKAVPEMKTWFALDPNRQHLMYQLWKRDYISNDKYGEWLKGRDGDHLNAPRIYFITGLRWTFRELRQWAVNPNTGLPESKHDHIPGGSMKYMLVDQPRYWGKMWDDAHTIVREEYAGDPLDHKNVKKMQKKKAKFVS